MEFVKGKAYFATPTMMGERRAIVVCTGRSGNAATFARVCRSKCAEVRSFDGRETAIIKSGDGLDYFVSASVEVDIELAEASLHMVKK